MSINSFKKIQEKHKLYLKWGAITNEGSGKIVLIRPTFVGPVLKDCEPIEESGELLLDFTDQCLVLLVKPYEVKISWKKKLYQDQDIIKFDEVMIEDTSFGHVTRLLTVRNSIVIDCSGHHTDDIQKGRYVRLFKSFLLKESGEPYSFAE